jgi:hypothetical protein
MSSFIPACNCQKNHLSMRLEKVLMSLFSPAMLVATNVALLAGTATHPLPDPPVADNIGEIMFIRKDGLGNREENVGFTRDELLLFFTSGKFYKSPALFDKIANVEPERNDQNGVMIATGYLATKDGRVFGWSRVNKHILRIFDAQNRTGFLLLPSAFKDNQKVDRK